MAVDELTTKKVGSLLQREIREDREVFRLVRGHSANMHCSANINTCL